MFEYLKALFKSKQEKEKIKVEAKISKEDKERILKMDKSEMIKQSSRLGI